MDYIVYRKETCKIIEKEDGYYRLVPVNDTSIKYKVPVDSNFLKKVITKEEIDRLLLEIPEINTIDLGEKQIEQEYKELMKSGTHEDLVKIIKTSYLRNQIRILNNKRISEIDDEYFKRAEKYLYEEIGIVLNLSFENTKEYIINKLKKQISF